MWEFLLVERVGIGCRFRKCVLSWLINSEGSGRELVGEGEKLHRADKGWCHRPSQLWWRRCLLSVQSEYLEVWEVEYPSKPLVEVGPWERLWVADENVQPFRWIEGGMRWFESVWNQVERWGYSIIEIQTVVRGLSQWWMVPQIARSNHWGMPLPQLLRWWNWEEWLRAIE